MHDALSHVRVHNPSMRVVAVYDPITCGAYVEKVKGNHFNTMGKWKDGSVWLAPEEALYLLERGTLDVRIPDDGLQVPEPASSVEGVAGDDSEVSQKDPSPTNPTAALLPEDGEQDPRLPMTLQAAYAAFIDMTQDTEFPVSIEMYQVYAGLRRCGYTVVRAEEAFEQDTCASPLPPSENGLMQRISRLIFGPQQGPLNTFTPALSTSQTRRARQGPIFAPGFYRSYDEVFDSLRLIPFHDPRNRNPANDFSPTRPHFCPLHNGGHDDAARDHPPAPPHRESPPHRGLRLCYNIYKPSSKYTKRAPPQPDFRVAVVSARDSDAPLLEDLAGLLASTPYDPPDPKSPLYARLKHGWRNVIVAVVDAGIVSYWNVSEAGFGTQDVRVVAKRDEKRGGAGRPRGHGAGKGSNKKR